MRAEGDALGRAEAVKSTPVPFVPYYIVYTLLRRQKICGRLTTPILL